MYILTHTIVMSVYLIEANPQLHSKISMIGEDANGINTFLSILGCDLGYEEKSKHERLCWGSFKLIVLI